MGSCCIRPPPDRRLDAVLDGAPDPVRTAVAALLPTLAAATNEDPLAARVARQLPTVGEGGFLLFPTTNCPGRCEICGTCRDDCVACPECADGSCEICLPVTLTPRTAAVLGTRWVNSPTKLRLRLPDRHVPRRAGVSRLSHRLIARSVSNLL